MKIPVCKVFLLLCAFFPALLFAQSKAPVLSLANNVNKTLEQVKADPKIDANASIKALSAYNNYAAVTATGTDYIYFYNDAYFGKVPLQVYIPAGYESTQPSPCIMMLHGAVGQSHFSDIDSSAPTDEDILFDILKKQDYIIIRPLGDSKKQFDWVVNQFASWRVQHANLTYKALNNILVSLKGVLNIDDDRVFALGHSDGSDGSVGLGVYAPDMYAGIVGYNSMLTNLTTRDFFIKNIVNRPLYLVHSDKDDLRPMTMTRDIVNKLKVFDDYIVYKEYFGYVHYDKHLTKDLPAAIEYMKGIKRNPYPSKVEWIAVSDTIYNACDWLRITKTDTSKTKAAWDTAFNSKSFNKTNGKYYDMDYYVYVPNSVSVKAKYANNIFEIQTSRVGEVELLISPIMVDLEKPVIVIANGKQVFSGKVKADKNYLLNNFKKTIDRHALWVNAIKVKVD